MKTLSKIIILTLLFSCQNRQDNGKSNLDNNKIDSTKSISHVDSSSKILKYSSIPHEFPFDTILNNCLESSGEDRQLNGGTTMGMIACFYNATNILDSIVNNMYKKLFSKLDKNDRQKLKKSQDCWRKYYAVESDFVYSAYYTSANFGKYGHGREHAITQAEWRYDIMRKRLIDLTKYDAEIFIEDSISK